MWVRFPLAWILIPKNRLSANNDYNYLVLRYLNRSLRPTFVYSFHFVSLINPLLTPDWDFVQAFHMPYAYGSQKKIYIKQSYLLLSWFRYFQTTTLAPRSFNKARLACLPIRRSKYTIVKAPMAHKTNSKEQIMFKFHFFRVTFVTKWSDCWIPSSWQGAAKAAYILKKNFPVFETNVFLLKSYKASFHFSDKNFLSFYKHLSK